jgi:hypothetical protein
VATLNLIAGLLNASCGNPGCDLGTGAKAEPGEDLFHVRLGRPDGDGQPGRDLPIGQSLCDQVCHLLLPASERKVVVMAPARRRRFSQRED